MNKTPPKKRQRPEEAIQKAVVAFCRAKQANVPGLEYLYHVPNGGKRTKAEARIFKAIFD